MELPLIRARIEELKARQSEIAQELVPKTADLQEWGTQLQAMRGNPHLAGRYEILEREVNALSETVRVLRREQSENASLLAALQLRAEKLQRGEPDDPRAHITHLAVPVSAARMRFNRLAEFWAAISVSVLLIIVALLALFAPQLILGGVIVLVVLFVLLEAALRGTYTTTINAIAVGLALAGIGVLAVLYWRQVLVVGLLAAAVFLLLQKMRELRE